MRNLVLLDSFENVLARFRKPRWSNLVAVSLQVTFRASVYFFFRRLAQLPTVSNAPGIASARQSAHGFPKPRDKKAKHACHQFTE